MVKRRDTHVRFRGELIDAEVFRVLALNTLEHAAYQTEVGLSAHQRQQRSPARAQQHMIENFANDLLAQDTRVQRPLHDVQQTLDGAQDLFRQRGRVNPA